METNEPNELIQALKKLTSNIIVCCGTVVSTLFVFDNLMNADGARATLTLSANPKTKTYSVSWRIWDEMTGHHFGLGEVFESVDQAGKDFIIFNLDLFQERKNVYYEPY